MKLWIAGRVLGVENWQWMFLGVFDDEQAARDACTQAIDFVGPCDLNVRLNDDIEYWPDAYFPLAKQP